MYVSQLNKEEQRTIEVKVVERLMQEGLTADEISEAVENALNSKVSDLSDILN